MAKQLALGTILGGIALFVWSFIAFTFIPWPGQPLKTFNNEAAVEQAITGNTSGSGNYILPNPHKPGLNAEQQQAASERMMRGPIVFAAIRLEPMRSFPMLLLCQLLTYFTAALIATFLLLKTCGLSYGHRVGFVALIGVLIFVGAEVNDWIWWSFSTAYMAMEFGAIVIGWILAALVIAKFAKGKPAAA